MAQKVTPALILGAILFLALLIRIPATTYGLPYHVFGDEETNVYGAMKMLELKTFLPVFHQDDFKILYEPPLLALTYAVLFVPTIGPLWLLQGMPALSQLSASLVLDPTVLWYVARIFSVCVSIGSLYLLYRIGKYLFKNETIALTATLFLALSFFETTLASTARHWTTATFFSLLALFFLLKAFDTHKRRYVIFSGVALGCAFGVGYLVFYVPVIAVLVIWRVLDSRGGKADKLKLFTTYSLSLAVPFAAFAALFVAIHPYPFFVQVINHVVDPATRSVQAFVVYYAHILWDFETPLTIGALVGAMALVWSRNRLSILFALFFAAVCIPMYIFLPNIERYVTPLLPMLALLSGYGVYTLASLVKERSRTIAVTALISALLIYSALLYYRYEVLIVKGDTRVAAKEWIEKNISQNSNIITNSDRIRLFAIPAALAAQSRIAPETLRAPDRLLFENRANINNRLNVYPLYFASSEEQKALVKDALQQDPHSYVVIDSWAKPSDALSQYKTRVMHFEGSAAVPGVDALFIGGDEHHAYQHVLSLLYGLNMLGPEISIYRL